MSLIGVRPLSNRAMLTEFGYELDQAFNRQWWSDIVVPIDSTQVDGEDHGWLGGVPDLREQTGDPEFSELRAMTYFIRNKTEQSGVRIKKADWRHQKNGMLKNRVGELAGMAAGRPGRMIQAAIVAGESQVCYDGQLFYDTDHLEGDSGEQSNDIEADVTTPAAPTAAEMAEALIDGATQIMCQKDDQGNECNLSATSFMAAVPKTHYKALLKALGQELIGNGESNIVAQVRGERRAFTIKPQLLPRATGNKLYMFRTDQGNGRPFIHQVLDAPELGILDDKSEYCVVHGHCLFTVDVTHNVAYGRWQGACLVTFV